jgi:hypothetical protein
MTSAYANSNLETTDPMIEIFSEKVCELDVIRFVPFESDLENAIKDNTVEYIMNKAYIECDYIDTKFSVFQCCYPRPYFKPYSI